MCLVCATTTTDKGIGPDGADVLALMLRMQVPLTTLDLRGEHSMAKHSNSSKDPRDGELKADNEIGDEGARGLGDALKTNATLTQLYLSREQQDHK